MTIWHDFLLHQSAHITAQGDLLFTRTTPTLSLYSPYVTELCQKSSFFVTGRDTLSFLQGQLTSDCKILSPNQACPTAICNPKGRVIATGLVSLWGDGVLITVDRSMKDFVFNHLKKFIFMAKVTLSELPELICLEAGGTEVRNLLEQHLGKPVDATPYAVTSHKQLQLIALPGERPRWIAYSTQVGCIIELWETLIEAASPIGTAEARDIDLQSNVLTIDAKLSEQFLPQMFDYDLIQGMSLKKGCYAGQEVLARTSHRGTIKRQLYRGRCEHSQHLRIGMPITMNDSDIGVLVAHSSTDLSNDILMILRTPAVEKNEPLSVNGQPIEDVKRAKPQMTGITK